MQRLRRQWATSGDGLLICNANNDQNTPQLANVGANGVVIAWEDLRYGDTDADIFVQRINFDGTIAWTEDGISVCNALHFQDKQQIVSNNTGGAIIAWEDFRRDNGPSNDSDIFLQNIDTNGFTQWTYNGVNASGIATTNELKPLLVSDGKNGAVITWEDWRVASNADIYAQRISSTGSLLWGQKGTPVCNASGFQSNQQLISDGNAGAIVTWTDPRNGNSDILCPANFFRWRFKPLFTNIFPCPHKERENHHYFLGVTYNLSQ